MTVASPAASPADLALGLQTRVEQVRSEARVAAEENIELGVPEASPDGQVIGGPPGLVEYLDLETRQTLQHPIVGRADHPCDPGSGVHLLQQRHDTGEQCDIA